MRRVLIGLLSLVGCSGPVTCPNGVIVLSTDEQVSSETGVLPLDGRPAVMLSGLDLGGDPVLARSAGRNFVINRTTDVFWELDSCGSGLGQYSGRAFDEQTQVDVQDLAVAPDGSFWIARFLVPTLLITNTSPTRTIDLSKLDSDGNPDMSSVRIVGSNAFVTIGRLTASAQGFVSQQTSEMLVFDVSSFSLVKEAQLLGRNPFGQMVESNGKLWLAEPGNFSDAAEPSAGIEAFDTTTLTSALVVNETTLQASVSEVAVSDACGAAIVADATPNVNRTSLVSFKLDGSSVKTAMGPTDGFDLRGLAWTPQNTLLVGDKRPKTGGYPVHVLTADPATCALTAGPDLTLPDLPALAFAP